MFQNTKQIILKITRGCNMRCSYCYVFDKNKYSDEIISDKIYEDTLRRWFSETIHGDNSPSEIVEKEITKEDGTKEIKKEEVFNTNPLSLVLHGGEPLNVGKENISKFSKIATQIAREYNKKVEIGVQTNGTLIDEDWIAIFRKFSISPGVSFDGFNESMELRDPKSKHDLINKILLMRSHGVNFGLLCILGRHNNKTIYKDFKILESMGIDSIKVNRLVDVRTEPGESSDELTPEEFFEAAKELCHFMWEGGFVKESNLIMSMKEFIHQRSPGLFKDQGARDAHCHTRYCGAGKNIVEIEPDGTILFCGRNSKRSKLVFNGDIYTPDVLELKSILSQWEFQEYKVDSIIEKKCNLCFAQSICDGGCLSFAYQKFKNPHVDDLTCGYYKRLAKFFSLNSKILSDYLTKIGEISQNEHIDKFSM